MLLSNLRRQCADCVLVGQRSKLNNERSLSFVTILMQSDDRLEEGALLKLGLLEGKDNEDWAESPGEAEGELEGPADGSDDGLKEGTLLKLRLLIMM